MELDAQNARLGEGIGAVGLGPGDGDPRVVRVLVQGPDRVVDEGAEGLDVDVDLRERMFHALEAADGLTELDPFLREVRRDLECGLGGSHRLGGDERCSEIEQPLRRRPAGAPLAQDAISAHPRVVEDESPDLLGEVHAVEVPGLDARSLAIDDDQGDRLGLGSGPYGDDEEIRRAGICDEELLAGHDQGVAILLGAGLDTRG